MTTQKTPSEEVKPMNNFDKAIYDHIKALETPQYKKWRKIYKKLSKRPDWGVMHYWYDKADDKVSTAVNSTAQKATKSKKGLK